ncbi:hypothetical protein EDD18DRAFT_1206282 [Armillaria luteobubalina]|uniref:Protein kinase domain-containing protein n=1 Tax=Armillaria luteobubalina TaxID=153913 RepID=A0AA39P9I0_9AGAR|nr:hypothetical protein EDD18DRAFT_1206282 [Armillaria luteobubalina]
MHYAQVFVDILQCHKWLYDHPKILHQDISMANIMYRTDDEGTVFGVLNDFDLSTLIPIEVVTPSLGWVRHHTWLSTPSRSGKVLAPVFIATI